MQDLKISLLMNIVGGSYCACFANVNGRLKLEGMAVRYIVLNLAECKNICCAMAEVDDDKNGGYVISPYDVLFDPRQIHNCPDE